MSLYTAQKHKKIIKKVLINSVDVTPICLEADTDSSYVKLFVYDKNGGPLLYIDEERKKSEFLISIAYGKVEVILHDLPQQLMDAGGVLED